MQRRGAARLSWRNRDHTQGSLLASMLVLALPSIGMGIAGAAMYQLVDLKFISLLGATPLAAVVVTNQTLRQLAFLMVMGVATVAQMMMAQFVGEGRIDQAEHIAGQVLVLGGLLCMLFALVGGFFPRELLELVTSDPAVLEAGTPYLRLVAILLFGFVLVPLFGAILGGAGDSTTPMVIMLIATPISLLAEWCLIFGNLGAPVMGIRGVAVGATIGSSVAVFFGLWIMLTGRCRIHLRPRHLIPDSAALGRLMRLFWRPALQLAARTAIVIYFMSLAGRFGPEYQAAYGIGIRLEMVVFTIGFPIANACATLVGQNLAAGSLPRAWRSVRIAMALEIGVCWSFALFLVLLRSQLVAFFSSDPAVIAAGSDYLLYSSAALLLIGPYFVAFRTLQGAGDLTAPMLISNTSALLVAIPLGRFLAFETSLGATGLWIGALCHVVVNTGVTLGWLATGRWTRRSPAALPPAQP